MKDSLRTVIFATVLGLVCASLLTAANVLLKDRQEANKQAEKLRHVFTVLDVPFNPDTSAAELLKLVRSKGNPDGKVIPPSVPEGGLRYYRYQHPQAGLLRAFEFEGPGLWGPVKGLLCLRNDLKTVFRISFYEQEETPGLGAEISGEGFTRKFQQKTIAPPTGSPGIRVVRPGTPTGDSAVDGITGATLTCDKVTAMLKEISQRILERREEILRETEAHHGK